MAKILVAGGAGFIGSHLCEELLSEGHEVICVDNFLTSSESNIQHLRENPSFRFINHDIIQPLPHDIDITYIYHLASPASPNMKSPRSYINYPIETLLVNSMGTFNLLNLAKEKGARFVFASTSEVYGDPEISPQPETYFGNVNPNGIRSMYDEAKRFGEAMTMTFVRKYDLDARIARIFNTYGERMQVDDGRMVSNFIVQALKNDPITIYGDGTQTRSFCYISDLLNALTKVMFTDQLKGEVFNIGNPDEHTVSEMAEHIKKMTQSSSQIVHEDLPADDPKQRRPDITKATRILGYEPKVTLEEGLIKTIDYFKKVI